MAASSAEAILAMVSKRGWQGGAAGVRKAVQTPATKAAEHGEDAAEAHVVVRAVAVEV